MMIPFNRSMRLQAEEIINLMPKDGCLLVFNAPHLAFRQAVYRLASGVLNMHVCERMKTREPQHNYPRNLYITWRE